MGFNNFGFGWGLPSGGGGSVLPITLNSSDKGAKIVLSGGDLSVAFSGTVGRQMVRATHKFSTGKLYYEYTMTEKLAQNQGWGWCNATHTVDDHVGFDADDEGMSYATNGRITRLGSQTQLTPAVIDNDVVGVAIDFSGGGKIWFAVAGTWVDSGDPAAGTGEQYTTFTGPLYPAVSLYQEGMLGTVNFGGSAFTYTVPSGFIAVNQGVAA
jgi:hypothetical protein